MARSRRRLFGYPTAWVNRLGQQAESFGAPPAVARRDLAVLDELLLHRSD
jgi:hypothetical protein